MGLLLHEVRVRHVAVIDILPGLPRRESNMRLATYINR